MPSNSASAASPAATGTPACRAAASAASAFRRLCRPSCGRSGGQRTMPCGAPAEGHRAVAVDPPIGRRRAVGRDELGAGEALDFGPRAARQHAIEARRLGVHDEAPRPGHGADEVMELGLDGGHVREDVGVVVFEVVEDRGARPVVHELRALVEERRVVFVGLDHEERAVGQPRRNAEIERHAADQEARIRGRRDRGSTPASTPSSSCRACRRPRAPICRRARARRATAAPTGTAGPRRESPR